MICVVANYARVIFVLLLIVVSSSIAANEKLFEHVNSNDGLLSDQVIRVFQDDDGFIWFCTRKGLMRYDGYELKIIEDPNNLDIDFKNLVIKGGGTRKNGEVWFASKLNGLFNYNRKTNEITKFDSLSIARKQIMSMHIDSKDRIWVASNKGIHRIASVTNKLTTFYLKGDPTNKWNSDYNTSITELSTGEIIVSDWYSKIYIYSEKDQSFTSFNLKDYTGLKNQIRIWDIYIDKQDNIWCSTWNDGVIVVGLNAEKNDIILKAHFGINKEINQRLNSLKVLSTCEDDNGDMWIGTSRGLSIIKNPFAEDYTIQQYSYTPNNNNGISFGYITHIFKDKTGIIWLATNGGGVNKFDPERILFSKINIIEEISHEINRKRLLKIFNDKNGQLIGLFKNDGFKKFNPNTGIFENLEKDGPLNTLYKEVFGIDYIIQDTLGNYWGAGKNRLYYLNKANGKLKAFDKTSSEYRGVHTECMYLHNDKLFIGNLFGLFVVNDVYGKKKLLRLQITDDKDERINVKSILVDKSDKLWVGTRARGVYRSSRLVAQSDTFFDIEPVKFKNNPVNNLIINSIIQTQNGSIWLGGSGDVLYLYNNQTQNIESFDKYCRIDCDEVYDLLEGDNGSLWMSSNRGLYSCFKADSLKHYFRNYTVEEGLQGNDFKKGLSCKDKEGYLYFGGYLGINKIKPDSVKFEVEHPVVITDVSVMNKPVFLDYDNDILTLNHKENYFSVSFSVLSYSLQHKNKYAYKLENFNEDWTYIGDRNFTTFYNLAPGDYVLHIKGANKYDVWNESNKTLKIEVLPPWWRTIWFKLILLFFIVSIVLAIFYYRIASLRKQKRILAIQVEDRTKDLKEKNTLLKQQSEDLSKSNQLLKQNQDTIEQQKEELEQTAINLDKLNQELKSINATKDKLFSIIAHDLINPFNIILGQTELLYSRLREDSNEENYKLIKSICESSNNAFILLENLLNWSRSQQGKLEYSPKIINASEVVNQVISEVQSIASNKNVKIHWSVYDFKILADKDMLMLVFRNLLINAIKFSHVGGEVSIKVDQLEKAFIRFGIVDNGVGINEEKLKTLFENENSPTNTFGTIGEKGTGLGLLLCKEFIELHQGKIWAESNVGVETTFYFTIPKE